MPQGRRRTPFSGKLKKQQLAAKKQTKGYRNSKLLKRPNNDETETDDDTPHADDVEKFNYQGGAGTSRNANRYAIQFYKESEKHIREMKEEAMKPLRNLNRDALEISDKFFDGYNFPVRPPWDYNMSKEQVDRNENRYFTEYKQILEKKHTNEGIPLSYWELNLETWRQLWRVLELSDIILVIVDIRYPTLMFPPSLYEYVTKELGKDMILALNKIDLAPSSVVVAWKNYFIQKYVGLKVVLFTSYPTYNLRGPQESARGLKIRRRRAKMHMAAEGAMNIYNVCKEIVKDDVDLASWEAKIQEELTKTETLSCDDGDEILIQGTHTEEKLFEFEKSEKYKNGILTIGCIGFPNVGKSSVMNALMGRKVCSVSRTPGHTKHFQTIFLTKNVRLCDCPGLVFPSSTPKSLQVLLGSYPIAQLREPFASIMYLAERLDLPKLLDIDHPEGGLSSWSTFDICDGWALKRGFLTAKAARPDTFRAANNILRMALEGRLCLFLLPVEYLLHEEQWTNHLDNAEVAAIQGQGRVVSNENVEIIEKSDSDGSETSSKDTSDGTISEINPFDILSNTNDVN